VPGAWVSRPQRVVVAHPHTEIGIFDEQPSAGLDKPCPRGITLYQHPCANVAAKFSQPCYLWNTL
jgi:hypothetical protein